MLGVIVLAMAFRLPHLNDRVLHGDEGNNTFKFRALWYDNAYKYDPHEYHGPSLPYLTLPMVWLSGADTFEQTTESTYRMLTALMGVLLVWMTFASRRWIGTPAAFGAAVLCAVSPAMTYYNRYYIHETPLVLFTFGAILAGLQYVRTRRVGWALICGLCIGLMHATKETCLLAWFAMGVALVVVLATRRGGDASPAAQSDGQAADDEPATLTRRVLCPLLAVTRWHVLAAAMVAVVVSVLLFSSFFTNPQGPVDSVMTYATYLHRGASGEGAAASHTAPWYYYLVLLAYQKPATGGGVWWSEGLVLAMAVFGLLAAATGVGVRRDHLPYVRFFAVYTVVLVVLYSGIAYKTPWSMLGFYHGLIIMAGVGVGMFMRITPTWVGKGLVILALCAGTYHLGWQAYRVNFLWHTNTRNPYFYAHAVSDVRRIAERAEQIAAVSPAGHEMLIYVISDDYWPLPFYLRRFDHVGYFHTMPKRIDAPFIVAGAGATELLDAQLDDRYVSESRGLRPSVFLTVYIRKDLWNAMLKAPR